MVSSTVNLKQFIKRGLIMNRKAILNDELIDRIKSMSEKYKELKKEYPSAYQLMLVYNLKSDDARTVLNQLKGGK